ncbi:MAG TPA: hypothetical protein VE244_14520 [Nitrososphaeraceae archaeon]|jgi:hypothetical protein|nr:hypothetical protein [Nitrososphaeraceae archaeon]
MMMQVITNPIPEKFKEEIVNGTIIYDKQKTSRESQPAEKSISEKFVILGNFYYRLKRQFIADIIRRTKR